MVTHNREELRNFIRDFKGHGFASCLTATDARAKKTGNPYGEVVKVSKKVIGLGYVYATSVSNEREKEGLDPNFVAEPLVWGQFVQGSKTLIEHKGNEYARVTLNANNPADNHYYDANGNEIPYENVEPFLPKSKQASTQGTEKPIVVNSINIENIKEFKLGDFHFVE